MTAGSRNATRSRRTEDGLSRGWIGIVSGSLFSIVMVLAGLIAGSDGPWFGDDVDAVSTSVTEIAAGRYRPGTAVRFAAVLLPHSLVRVEAPGRRHLVLAVEHDCGLLERASGLRDDLLAFRESRFPIPSGAEEDEAALSAAEAGFEAISDRADVLLGSELDTCTPVAIRVDRLDSTVARMELEAFVPVAGHGPPPTIDMEAIERAALERTIRGLAAAEAEGERPDAASRWRRLLEDASCLEAMLSRLIRQPERTIEGVVEERDGDTEAAFSRAVRCVPAAIVGEPVESGDGAGPGPFATSDVLVTSRPAGARLTVDGRGVGRTPVVLRDVEVGRVLSLGLSREGCAPRTTTRTAMASAGRAVRIEVELEPAR